MKYSIIKTNKGEEFGLRPILHRLLADGKKMIVNERELLRINPDIATAAAQLGGSVLSFAELQQEINKNLE